MRVRIGAHRGAMCYAPENTLTAFAKAVELGTWRIETDVRRTRDGVLVLLHDATLDRTTDGAGPVAEIDYADLRRLRAGGEPVPTLSEALEYARDRVRLLVEIKDHEAVDDIVTVIRAAGMVPACTISCFNQEVLARVKELCPDLATALFHVKPDEPDPMPAVARLGVSLAIVWPAAATDERIAAFKAAGLDIRAGFPDHLTYAETAAGIRRLADLGVDEISCGRPDWVARALMDAQDEGG